MTDYSMYLIGSLRNPAILEIGNKLRSVGWDVFDDWFAAGPEADDYWQKYEKGRGRTYAEALKGRAVTNVVNFDELNLNRCQRATLVMPAGKSGHLELGRSVGQGKPCSILFDKEPERWDAMYALDGITVFFSVDEYIAFMAREIQVLKSDATITKIISGVVDEHVSGLRLDRMQMMVPKTPDGRQVIGRDGYCMRSETRCLCNQHNRVCCDQWVTYMPGEAVA